MSRNLDPYSQCAWSDVLQCYWESIYPLGKEMLVIRVPTDGGPDMLGAVDLANFVMPEATMICVMNPDGPQMTYFKQGTTWQANPFE
jgi:hypothetical protein